MTKNVQLLKYIVMEYNILFSIDILCNNNKYIVYYLENYLTNMHILFLFQLDYFVWIQLQIFL